MTSQKLVNTTLDDGRQIAVNCVLIAFGHLFFALVSSMLTNVLMTSGLLCIYCFTYLFENYELIQILPFQEKITQSFDEIVDAINRGIHNMSRWVMLSIFH